MRKTLSALALSLAVVAPALATQAPMPTGVIAHPDWSAGYEAAYLDLCDVTPVQRAAWASPVASKGPRIDAGEYASGFIAATEDAAAYEEEGFDRYEYCGDNHP